MSTSKLPHEHLLKFGAEAGAAVLSDLCQWTVDYCPYLLPTRAVGYFLAADVDTLLVPAVAVTGDFLSKVSSVARETRCDAVVVQISQTYPMHLYCCVQIWKPQVTEWSICRLWLTPQGEGWLIPDPADVARSDRFIPLQPGRLRVSANPPVEAVASVKVV